MYHGKPLDHIGLGSHHFPSFAIIFPIKMGSYVSFSDTPRIAKAVSDAGLQHSDASLGSQWYRVNPLQVFWVIMACILDYFFLNILEYDQSVMIWTIKQLNDPFQSIVFSVSRSCSFDDCFMSGSRRAKALTSWPRRHQRVINPVNSLFGCWTGEVHLVYLLLWKVMINHTVLDFCLSFQVSPPISGLL